MDDKQPIIAANSQTEKYFFNPDFDKIPTEVQKELRIMAVKAANALSCVFIIGFYPHGRVYFETLELPDQADDDAYIEALITQQGELIRSLELWHKVFIQKDLDDLI